MARGVDGGRPKTRKCPLAEDMGKCFKTNILFQVLLLKYSIEQGLFLGRKHMIEVHRKVGWTNGMTLRATCT